ncbi:MAG TPA: glycosyltransferase, partial [Roseiflexaceae bacterium]|nr:glycosyltransferase [Roseiflexaceae bacterium]
GLPVVASDIGGIPHALDQGVNGLLAPPGDVAAWSTALVQLLSDRRRMQAMGEVARQVAVARFSRSRMLADVEQLLSELGIQHHG